MDTKPTLMIIDDDDRFRTRLERSFTNRGYAVVAFEEGKAAVNHLTETLNHNPIQYVIVDLKLASEWGLNIVESLLDLDPSVSIVVLTAYGSIATAIEALKLGALNYIQKPASVIDIENALLNKKLIETKSNLENVDTPSLAKVEWEHINRVLTDCDGNIRQTAQKLGMHRRTLQRKLAKFPVLK